MRLPAAPVVTGFQKASVRQYRGFLISVPENDALRHRLALPADLEGASPSRNRSSR